MNTGDMTTKLDSGEITFKQACKSVGEDLRKIREQAEKMLAEIRSAK